MTEERGQRCAGSTEMLLAPFLTLDLYRTWMEGRLVPVIRSVPVLFDGRPKPHRHDGGVKLDQQFFLSWSRKSKLCSCSGQIDSQSRFSCTINIADVRHHEFLSF
ncbi:hypothetical protein fugu_018808 [Takifugu bimaculatus]|uniref:Uncharacterized protein n=1 Tax=Takifugu bimaculatus TaxID=433685 RepID=A0A4Z2BJ69_9TELE|nr:hypothetical protein fugu_018808 [Takifugu bimaculatus]